MAQDKIDVKAAFMSFIDNDRIVGFQHGVFLDLIKQDAVGHYLYCSVALRLVGKADFSADFIAKANSKLLGDALGDRQCGDATWLGATDDAAGFARVGIEQELGQLGGFTGSGFTSNNKYRVLCECADNCFPF